MLRSSMVTTVLAFSLVLSACQKSPNKSANAIQSGTHIKFSNTAGSNAINPNAAALNQAHGDQILAQQKAAADAATTPAEKELKKAATSQDVVAAGGQASFDTINPNVVAPAADPASATPKAPATEVVGQEASSLAVPNSSAPAPSGDAITPVAPPAQTVSFLTFETKDPSWSPGLPLEKADIAIQTGGTRKGDGLSFTDGYADEVLKLLQNEQIASEAKLPDTREGSAEIRSHISKVELTNVDKNWALKVRINNGDHPIIVNLSGPKNKKGSLLKQVGSADAGFSYQARVTCLREKNCKTNLIYFYRYSDAVNAVKATAKTKAVAKKDAKLLAVVYMVYRVSEPILTLSSENASGDHAAFETILSNAKINACLREKKSAKDSVKVALEQLCPGTVAKSDDRAELKTWSVLGGAASYEFDLLKAEKVTSSLSGDLIQINRSESSKLTGDIVQSALNAQLMANDGGGSLNFEVNFKGNPAESSRFSVTARGERGAHVVQTADAAVPAPGKAQAK